MKFICCMYVLLKEFHACYLQHQALCEFPAHTLYKTFIDVSREDQKKPSILKCWPQSRDKPMAFVQVEGLVNYSDNRDVNTKYNTEEISQVVSNSPLLVICHWLLKIERN